MDVKDVEGIDDDAAMIDWVFNDEELAASASMLQALTHAMFPNPDHVMVGMSAMLLANSIALKSLSDRKGQDKADNKLRDGSYAIAEKLPEILRSAADRFEAAAAEYKASAPKAESVA